jgi:hypothetical protein
VLVGIRRVDLYCQGGSGEDQQLLVDRRRDRLPPGAGVQDQCLPARRTEGRKGMSKKAKRDTIVVVGSKSLLACQATLTGCAAVTVEVLGALPC